MFLSRGLVCPFSSACFRWIILFARPDRSSLLFSFLSPFPLFVLTIGQKGVLLISLIVCLFLVAYPVGACLPGGCSLCWFDGVPRLLACQYEVTSVHRSSTGHWSRWYWHHVWSTGSL